MKKYKVMLNGQNLLVDTGEGPGKHGFYTTCYVAALNKGDAELNAVSLVQKQNNIKQMLRNEKNDAPMFYAEEIVEIESGSNDDMEPGISWFKED